MLLHTILDPLAIMEQPVQPQQGVCWLSPHCACEWISDGQGRRLRRVMSTDLSSYLDPRLQPGADFSLPQQSGTADLDPDSLETR